MPTYKSVFANLCTLFFVSYCRSSQWAFMALSRFGRSSAAKRILAHVGGKNNSCHLRYFGHVTRMDKCRLPYIALFGRVEGNRAKGRPRKRWLDNVTEDCKRRGWDIVEATRLAADRQYWRSYTRLSQRASASPWQQQQEEDEVTS